MEHFFLMSGLGHRQKKRTRILETDHICVAVCFRWLTVIHVRLFCQHKVICESFSFIGYIGLGYFIRKQQEHWIHPRFVRRWQLLLNRISGRIISLNCQHHLKAIFGGSKIVYILLVTLIQGGGGEFRTILNTDIHLHKIYFFIDFGYDMLFRNSPNYKMTIL